MAHEAYDTFEAVKVRLDEIVEAVSDDDLSLDEALALYEEAVGLGLRASDLLEEGIEAHRPAEDEVAGEGGESAGAVDGSADAADDGASADMPRSTADAADAGRSMGAPASA